MNKDQKGLIYLLQAAMHDEKVDQNKISRLNWTEIFELAKEQQIYTLIYPIIKNLVLESKEDNDILIQWKKVAIFSSVFQKQNINRISTILNKFEQDKMEVIALKGLVMRTYFSLAELRTMSDYDILMHVEDLEKAKNILLTMGYIEDHRDSKHILFNHNRFLSIEIHWLLTDPNHFKFGKYLENNIWENCENVNLCGREVPAPSLENQMLHLCLHLVVHFIHSGFGLRQLTDIFVLVEQRGVDMDWNSFNEKIIECKIQRFVIVIFEICRRLLGMKVPDVLRDKSLDGDKNIDILIHSILFGGAHEGVFGKVLTLGPLDEKLLGHHEKLKTSSHFWDNSKYLMTIVFPETKRLKAKYTYSNKYPLLIPVAWTQRLVEGVIRKDFSFSKKKHLLSSKAEILKSKAEIFKWLDLNETV